MDTINIIHGRIIVLDINMNKLLWITKFFEYLTQIHIKDSTVIIFNLKSYKIIFNKKFYKTMT